MVAAQESSQARQKLGGCVLRRVGEERGLEAGAAESVAAVVVVVIVASFHERFTVALVDTFCQIFTNFHLSAKRRRQNCLCSGVRPPLSVSLSLRLCLVSTSFAAVNCLLFCLLGFAFVLYFVLQSISNQTELEHKAWANTDERDIADEQTDRERPTHAQLK